ncbi:MAG: 1,4-dihydroxy-2-naphthoate octaprenyltransferase [Planctomycetaceae bacterium]|nr:1,4-dihydroxy-2-naphthoate octaprenyltransferase [Planctomycetaceae bacterium]
MKSPEHQNPVAAVPENKLRIWVQALRPFSYTASMTPVFLGAALVVFLQEQARWILMPLVVIASFAIHAGTNLISDYYDYKKGVDRPGTYGGSRVLVEGLLRPSQVFIAGLLMFALSALLGLIFIWQRGIGILLIGLAGMIGGLFYTVSKRFGLGDLAVFILMGPLMTIGAFFVLTGDYSHYVPLVSLPIACHVAAILSANNLRDISSDRTARVRTAATILGHFLARWEYSILVGGAFVIVLALIIRRVLPAWSFLTWLCLPLALSNIKAALSNASDRPDLIISLDVRTAKLHLAFGVLLIISLLLGAIR